MGGCTSKPKTAEYDGVMEPLTKGGDTGRRSVDTGRQIIDSSKDGAQFLNSTSKNSERSLQKLFIKHDQTTDSLLDRNTTNLQDIQLDLDKVKKQTDDDTMNRDIKKAESFQERWPEDDSSQLKPEKDQNKEKAVSTEAAEISLQEAKTVPVAETEAEIASEAPGHEVNATHFEEQRTKPVSYQLKDEERQRIEELASPDTQDPAETLECTELISEDARTVAIAEAVPLVAIATEFEVVSVDEQLTEHTPLHGKEESISSSAAVADLLLDTIKDPSPEAKVVNVGEIKSLAAGEAAATDAEREFKGTVEALEVQRSERAKSNIAERKEQKQEPAVEMDAVMIQAVANQSYQSTNKEAACADDLACLSQQTVRETDAEIGCFEVSTRSWEFVQGITSVCSVLGEDAIASGTPTEEDNYKQREVKEETDLPSYQFVEGSDMVSAISDAKGGSLHERLLTMSAATLSLDERSEGVKASEKMKERIEDASNICPEGQNLEYCNNQRSGQSSECGPCVKPLEHATLSLESENPLLEDKKLVAVAETIAQHSITENATEVPSEKSKIMEVDHSLSKKTSNVRGLETNEAVVEYSLKQMDAGILPAMDTGNEIEIAGSAFAMALESEDTPAKAITLVDLSEENKTEMQELLDSGVISEAPLGSQMEPGMDAGNETEIAGSAFAMALENEDTLAKSITLVDLSKEDKTEVQEVLDSKVITEAPLGLGTDPGMDPGNEIEVGGSIFAMALGNEDTPAKSITLADFSKEDKTEMQEVLDSGVITEAPLGSQIEPGMDAGNETEIAGSAFAMALENKDTPAKSITLVGLSKEDKTEVQEVLDSKVITEAPLGLGTDPGNETEVDRSIIAMALGNEGTPAKSITLADFSKEDKTIMQEVLDSGVIPEAPLGSGMEPGMDTENETEIAVSAFAMAFENEDTPAKSITLVDLSKADKTEVQEVLALLAITEAPLGSGVLFEGHDGDEFLSAELDETMADTGCISEMECQPCAMEKNIALMICSDRDEAIGTVILSNDMSEPQTCMQVDSSSSPVLARNSCELTDQSNSIENGIAELARQSSSALPKEIGQRLQKNSDLALHTLKTAHLEYQPESVPEGMEGLQNLEFPSRAITSSTMLTAEDSEHMPNLEEPLLSSHIQEMSQPAPCALESRDAEQIIGNGNNVLPSETAFVSGVSGVVSQEQMIVTIPEVKKAGIAADLIYVETGLVTQFVETVPVLQGIDGNKVDHSLTESVQELLEGSGNTEEINYIGQVELSQGEVVESEKLMSASTENFQEIQEVDNTVKAASNTDIPSETIQALKDPILESSRIEQGVVMSILSTVKSLGSEGKTKKDLLPEVDESVQQPGEEASVLLKSDTGITEPEGFGLDANEPVICIEETELSLQEKAISTESICVTHVPEVDNQVFPDNIDQVLEKLASEFERQASADIHYKAAAATESALQESTELKQL